MSHQAALPDDRNDGDGTIIEPAAFRPPGAGLELPRGRVPWVAGVVAVLVVVSLAAVWFVLTARSVGIVTIPETASITVRAWPAPRVGQHWLLREGQRRVRVEAPGYIAFDDNIAVSDAQIQTHEIALQKLPGHLRVNISPAATAALLVDGEPFGSAPGLVEDVPAGMHEIEIRTERFQPWYEQIEIEGKGIEQAISATLEPAWADVTLQSRPEGATVTADGEVVGTAPITLELLAGRRVLQLSSPGYKTWKRTLVIKPGVAVALGEVALAKADGKLRVTSTPPGANVTIDGAFQGLTPVDIAVTPDKAHTVRLIKEGYKPGEQQVRVGSGDSEAVNLELTPELAVIHLVTSPADATLAVNGEPRGNATQTLELPAHEHEITVAAPGHATFQTRITPRKGTEKRFRIRLKTAAQMAGGDAGQARGRRAAATGPSKGTITAYAGQELKLFTGGRVVLGSSRRQSARRGNEVQREAVLERPFYLSVREVTNGQYREFLAAHQSGDFKGQTLDDDRQAVTNISWANAVLYCNWLSRRDGLTPFYQVKFGEVLGVNPDANGYRLPTEAEWEWAAHANNNAAAGTGTPFVWGDRFPPRERTGNYADKAAADVIGSTLKGYDDGFAVAAPVGSFPPNARGVYDMDGNVAEWVHDFYNAAPATTPVRDPLGPPTGAQHVIKGGSWALGTATALRIAYRDAGDEPRDDVGFRLARYAR